MKGCLQARQRRSETIAAAMLRLNVLVQQYVKNGPREEDPEAKKEGQFSGEVGEEDGLEEHPLSSRRFSTTFVSPLTEFFERETAQHVHHFTTPLALAFDSRF